MGGREPEGESADPAAPDDEAPVELTPCPAGLPAPKLRPASLSKTDRSWATSVHESTGSADSCAASTADWMKTMSID
eukprot:13835327-Alexandrium_andersonii.AAC.1